MPSPRSRRVAGDVISACLFRIDLRRIAMEGCGLVRGQKRRKRRCDTGTYDIPRSELEQACE